MSLERPRSLTQCAQYVRRCFLWPPFVEEIRDDLLFILRIPGFDEVRPFVNLSLVALLAPDGDAQVVDSVKLYNDALEMAFASRADFAVGKAPLQPLTTVRRNLDESGLAQLGPLLDSAAAALGLKDAFDRLAPPSPFDRHVVSIVNWVRSLTRDVAQRTRAELTVALTPDKTISALTPAGRRSLPLVFTSTMTDAPLPTVLLSAMSEQTTAFVIWGNTVTGDSVVNEYTTQLSPTVDDIYAELAREGLTLDMIREPKGDAVTHIIAAIGIGGALWYRVSVLRSVLFGLALWIGVSIMRG